MAAKYFMAVKRVLNLIIISYLAAFVYLNVYRWKEQMKTRRKAGAVLGAAQTEKSASETELETVLKTTVGTA